MNLCGLEKTAGKRQGWGGLRTVLRPLCLMLPAILLMLASTPARAVCSSPAGAAGALIYNTDEAVPQYCDGTDWVRMAPIVDVPSGCPDIGDTCDDGSVYVGLSPDGNERMFATAADAPGGLPWNNANNSGYVNLYTPITQSMEDGDGSTAAFIGVDADSGSAGIQPFQAPEYCDSLSAHGHDDWYVPAFDEFMVMQPNYAAIGGFGGTYYWTASEICCDAMLYINVTNATSGSGVKNTANQLRCVRKAGNPVAGATGDFTTGLIGHWSLNETTGTIVYDSAGANNGTMSGGLSAANNSVTGVRDSALQFDGIDDQIDLGSNAALQTSLPISVSAWVYMDPSAGGVNFPIFRSNLVDNAYWGYWLNLSTSGEVEISFGDGTGAASTGRRTKTGATVLDTGKWYHVVGVMRGAGDMDIYLDGVDDGGSYSGTGGVLAYNGAGPEVIGFNDYGTPSWYANGIIDDVRIYSRALTDTDVRALYLNSDKYCLDPEGVPGQLHYNTDTHTPMYCDGGNWVGVGREPVTDGLKAHWKLDETSGLVAEDSAGSWDGTFRTGGNAAWAADQGVSGGAYEVFGDASDTDGIRMDYADQAFHDLFNTVPFSVSVWVKPDSIGTFQTVIVKRAQNGQWRSWRLQLRDTGLMAFGMTTAGGSAQSMYSDSALTVGEWYHVVGLMDSNYDLTMYVNGVLQADTLDMADMWVSDDYLQIGQEDSLSDEFDGLIDDVRFYNRLLSPSEITTLYKTGTRPLIGDTSLVAYWPLNESGGTTAIDFAAAGNHGTLENGPIFQSSGGQVGGALEFDGTDDILFVPDSPVLDDMSKITVTGWIYPEGWGGGGFGRIHTKETTASDGGLEIYVGDAVNQRLYVRSNRPTADGVWRSPDAAVTLNTWQHFAITYDDSSVANDPKIYINGAEVTITENTTPSGAPASDAGAVITLGNTESYTRGFDGLIDDYRIYNRILTAAEIAEIYTAGNAGLAVQDCASPNGAEGVMLFNTDVNAVQYCDGANWVRLGK